jgi:adenylosuccinate lyase
LPLKVYICAFQTKQQNNDYFKQIECYFSIDGDIETRLFLWLLFFSEEALIKYRVLVEIEYFIALCEVPLPQLSGVNPDLFDTLRNIYKTSLLLKTLWIKETEK